MHCVRNVGCQKYHRERSEYLRSVYCYYRCDQAEYSDRSHLDYSSHDDHEHFVSTVDPFLERKAFVSGNYDTESDKECDNDYLQHGVIYHRLEQIGREDIDYRVHKARRLCSFIFQCACLQDFICSLENV